MSGPDPRAEAHDSADLARLAETRRARAEPSDLLEGPGPTLLRSWLWLSALVVAVLGALLALGQVDVVVSVRAEVAPEREMITLQAREAGTLAEVPVSVGDRVEAGALVARLAGTAARADLQAREQRLVVARAALDRLEAELQALDAIERGEPVPRAALGGAVDLVSALDLARDDLARQQRRTGPELDQAARQTEAHVAAIEATATARARSLEQARAQLAVLEETRELRAQQFSQTEDLIARGISTRERLLQARDQALAAEAALSDQRERIAELELAMASDRLRQADLRLGQDQEAARRRDALEGAERAVAAAAAALSARRASLAVDIAARRADLAAEEDLLRLQQERTAALEIRTTQAGVVAALPYPAAGAVVPEGAVIARIVPEGSRQILAARLPGREAGRVRPGQPAVVKLDAFPHQRFGTLPARVARVFPNPDGPDFVLRLELLEDSIVTPLRREPVVSGYMADVEIITDRRRLGALLLDQGRDRIAAGPSE